MDPFPEPPAVTEHQEALQPVDHDELEDTVNVVVPAVEVTILFDGETDRVGVKVAAVKEPAIPGAWGVQT